MKKLMRKVNFAILGIMMSVPAMAAVNTNQMLCDLAEQFGEIFNLMRTLMFVGAGISIATWAWGYISKGDFKPDELKTKGAGMLVGFFLLFSIGTLLTVFMNMAGTGGSLNCIGKFFD